MTAVKKAKKPPAPPVLFLRIRHYVGARFVSMWLCKREQASVSALLFGELLPAVAEEIAAALGLEVVREECALAGAVPLTVPGCASVEEQALLDFGG